MTALAKLDDMNKFEKGDIPDTRSPAWPERILISIFVLSGAFALFYHWCIGHGTLFKFGEVSMPRTVWAFLWVRGSYDQPIQWWHGLAATFSDVFLGLTAIFYIPLRGIYWALQRMKQTLPK